MQNFLIYLRGDKDKNIKPIAKSKFKALINKTK